MRTAGYYVILILIIVILIPLLIIKSCSRVEKDILEDVKGKKIKVYFHITKKVEEMSLEEYVRGVTAAEMPASYGMEAIKAQVVAARTYAYNKIISGGKSLPEHSGADICTDSTHCQAWRSKPDALKGWPKSKANEYWNKISLAVKDTAGQMIYFDGKLANPLFHANSGGKTENSEDAWQGVIVPYLRSVQSPGEESSSTYLSKQEISIDEFIKRIKDNYPAFKINKKDCMKEIKVIDFTEGGRVKIIQIGNQTLQGTEMRKIFDLRSANFSISISSNKFVFTVKGFGHGVGMSQCGANAFAQKGTGYKDILKYYYKGVEVK